MQEILDTERQPSEGAEELVLGSHEKQVLIECGLDPAQVGKNVGRGWNSKVYEYTLPDSDEQWVVKIPSRRPFGIRSNVEEEERNIATIQQYFPEFAPSSIIKKNSETKQFCLLMKYIDGFALSQDNIQKKDVREQFAKILKANKKMVEEQGSSLDFVGVAEYIKRHLPQLRESDPKQLPNLLVETKGEENNVWIIDHDLLYFGKEKHATKQSLITKLVVLLSYNGNKKFIKNQFGMEM